ncbi:MAG: spore coat protein U domain-containing protein [Burkholderiaceae bacterium]|nr:spore coat protein U domain-containing protein [Burkholderiaceae bacterium]
MTLRLKILWRAIGLLASVTICGAVQAAVSCSVTATLPASTYIATTATATTGSVTVTCSRLLTDPTSASTGYNSGTGTVAYTIGTDQGANTGTTIAVFGANQLNYDLFRPTAFTSAWTTNTTAGTVTFPSGATMASNATQFQMKVAAGLWTSPEGTYTELVTVTLIHGTQNKLTNFTNSVQINPICTFPTAPGDVDFGPYNALATGVALTATTPFRIRCTKGVLFSLAFDAAANTLLGLNYGLTITPNASATSGGSTLTRNISGTMAAGQAGICNSATCVGSQPRTLTLSY